VSKHAIHADLPAVLKLPLAILAMQLQAAAQKSLLAILVQLLAATPDADAERRSAVYSRRSSPARSLRATPVVQILVQPLAMQLLLAAAPADRLL
jgi:hypothetical protein